MLPRLALLLFVFPLTLVLAEEPQSNGAVPGLLPPVMEFQCASRMEGRTILRIAEEVATHGAGSLKSKMPITTGVAMGMTVTGVLEKNQSWRVQGLERAIAPIRAHLLRMAQQVEESENFTGTQKGILNLWLNKFKAADEACKKEPSLAKLSALADVLLNDIAPVFESIERPEVTLLEAIEEASAISKQLRPLSNYFNRVLALHKARDERAEDYPLMAGGLAMSPGAILYGIKLRPPLSGLKETFGDRLAKIVTRLKAVEKTSGLFSGHHEPVAPLIKALEEHQQKLDEGSFQNLARTINLMDRVENIWFGSEPLAPGALRIAVGVYTFHQSSLFSELTTKVREDVKAGKAVFEYTLSDGLKAIYTPRRGGMSEITLESDSKVTTELNTLLRVAEQTLKQSKMGEGDRKVLTDAIDAMKSSKSALGKSTVYNQWANWSNTINDIHKLYKY